MRPVEIVLTLLLFALNLTARAVWTELREMRKRAGLMPPPKKRPVITRKL